MTRVIWDAVGERYYETGADRCVLYVISKTDGAAKADYTKGVGWNGFRQLTETRDGADETALYANNHKYLGLRAVENFGGTIGAYTYPDEWMECDGCRAPAKGLHIGQQPRKPFGLTYRTFVGNDTDGNEHGYIIHVVYNATASPSNREYNTINDSPEAAELSWDFTTTPIPVVGYESQYENMSHLEIDSRYVDAAKIKVIEDTLYGTDDAEPKIMLPEELIKLLATEGAGD